MSVYMQYGNNRILANCIFQPSSLVGFGLLLPQYSNSPPNPPETRAELFNRIANTCPNAMARWSLVTQGRATAQKHVGDTLTGHRSVEAVAQGGEKPHAAPLERTDKLATGELLFNKMKENK